MDTTLKNDIIQTILSMPPIDRIDILNKIYEGFETDNSNEYEFLWAKESESRIDGFLNSSITSKPAFEVFNNINKIR